MDARIRQCSNRAWNTQFFCIEYKRTDFVLDSSTNFCGFSDENRLVSSG